MKNHHENMVKLAQHHRLAPVALLHDILNGIISYAIEVHERKNLVPLIKFVLDQFQIEVLHLYMLATNEFTMILHILMVSNTNLLDLGKFLLLPIHFNFMTNISITPDFSITNLLAIGNSKSFQTISSSDLYCCLPLGDTFFCKAREVMETDLKRSCLGTLYLAKSEAIQITCQFKIAEARDFELAKNTWAVKSTGTINTNQVFPSKNSGRKTHSVRGRNHCQPRVLHPDDGSCQFN